MSSAKQAWQELNEVSKAALFLAMTGARSGLSEQAVFVLQQKENGTTAVKRRPAKNGDASHSLSH